MINSVLWYLINIYIYIKFIEMIFSRADRDLLILAFFFSRFFVVFVLFVFSDSVKFIKFIILFFLVSDFDLFLMIWLNVMVIIVWVLLLVVFMLVDVTVRLVVFGENWYNINIILIFLIFNDFFFFKGVSSNKNLIIYIFNI